MWTDSMTLLQCQNFTINNYIKIKVTTLLWDKHSNINGFILHIIWISFYVENNIKHKGKCWCGSSSVIGPHRFIESSSIKRSGLVGVDVVLLVHDISVHFPLPDDSDVLFLAPPAPCLLITCHIYHLDNNGLNLQNCKLAPIKCCSFKSCHGHCIYSQQ